MCFIRHVKITSDMHRRPTLNVAGVCGPGTGLTEASYRCDATVVAVLIVLLVSGCSSLPWAKVPLDATAGFYDSASLTYRVDAGALQQSLDVSRVERQQVSYEQVASSPQANQSIGTLSVIYPHPLGRSGLAQAQFTLASGVPGNSASGTSRWNPFKKKKPVQQLSLSTAGPLGEIEERWALDVPVNESNQLFKMLATQGFYETERPGAVGVQLSARINGREVSKNWDQVPELNALVLRVRREGQLIAYHRASAAAGKPAQQIASTRAYSDLIANLGSRGAPAASPPSPMASPFAMTSPVPPQQGINVASLPAMTR